MSLFFFFFFFEVQVSEAPSIDASLLDGTMKSFSLSFSLPHRYASTLDRSIERASLHPLSASSSWPEASAACAVRSAVLRDDMGIDK